MPKKCLDCERVAPAGDTYCESCMTQFKDSMYRITAFVDQNRKYEPTLRDFLQYFDRLKAENKEVPAYIELRHLRQFLEAK
jgi:hypothetical protein